MSLPMRELLPPARTKAVMLGSSSNLHVQIIHSSVSDWKANIRPTWQSRKHHSSTSVIPLLPRPTSLSTTNSGTLVKSSLLRSSKLDQLSPLTNAAISFLFFSLTQVAANCKPQHAARARRAVSVNDFQYRDAVLARACERRLKLLVSLIASGKSLFQIDDSYSARHNPCLGDRGALHHFTSLRL